MEGERIIEHTSRFQQVVITLFVLNGSNFRFDDQSGGAAIILVSKEYNFPTITEEINQKIAPGHAAIMFFKNIMKLEKTKSEIEDMLGA